MDELVEQALRFIRADIDGVKQAVEANKKQAEKNIESIQSLVTEGIRSIEGQMHESNNKVQVHILEDARLFERLTAVCDQNTKSLIERDRRLFGDDGNSGVISSIKDALQLSGTTTAKRFNSIELKIALAIGGGIVIIYFLNTFVVTGKLKIF